MEYSKIKFLYSPPICQVLDLEYLETNTLSAALSLSAVSVADIINHPTRPTTYRIALTLAQMVRSNSMIPGIGSSGFSSQDIITILLFVSTTASYAAEQLMLAKCNAS